MLEVCTCMKIRNETKEQQIVELFAELSRTNPTKARKIHLQNEELLAKICGVQSGCLHIYISCNATSIVLLRELLDSGELIQILQLWMRSLVSEVQSHDYIILQYVSFVNYCEVLEYLKIKGL